MATAWKLTDGEMAFARRCYQHGVSSPVMARNLKIPIARADSLYDTFRDQGLSRDGRNIGLPVTLPRLRYMEGSNA